MTEPNKTPAEKAKEAHDRLRKKAIAYDKKGRHTDAAFLHFCADIADKKSQEEEASK